MSLYDVFVHPEGVAGEHGARLMAKAGASMAREAARTLAIDDPTASVLEVGFGPGVGLAALASLLPRGRIVGVDPSALMRRYAARLNADGVAAGRIVVLDGTADSLPVADASMDGAMIIDNLHFWPDPFAGLREIARALRPNAPVVCGFTPPSGGPPQNLLEIFAKAGYTDIKEHRAPAGYLLHSIRSIDSTVLSRIP